MYKLKNKIDNVMPEYYINNFGDILYGIKNKNELFFNQEMIYKGKINSFRLFNKSIFISKSDEKIFINENIKRKINIDFGFFIVDDFSVLFNLYSNDYSKQYYKYYNFKEDKEYWTIEKYFGNFIHQDNYLFTSCFDKNYLSKKICKISLTTPQTPQWQFDLSQLGTFYSELSQQQEAYKVEKFIGIHQDRLYVALNGGMLLEIDIATGELTHRWEGDFSTRNFSLDTSKNELVSLHNREYHHINIDTKEHNIINIKSELEKYDIVFIRHQGDISSSHIYAIAHLKNDIWFKDGIVAFNRKTQKIDWFYEDETFTTGTDTPKIAGNKLYQLSLNNELYIFEKTSNEI